MIIKNSTNIFIILLLTVTFWACDDSSNTHSFSPSFPNVLYEEYDEYIVASDYNEYTLTISYSGYYEIAVYNTESDLAWYIEDSSLTLLYECDYYVSAHDEVLTVYISTPGTYYLTVEEWDNVDSYYDIMITY